MLWIQQSQWGPGVLEAKLRKIKALNLLHNKCERVRNTPRSSHLSFPTTFKLFLAADSLKICDDWPSKPRVWVIEGVWKCRSGNPRERGKGPPLPRPSASSLSSSTCRLMSVPLTIPALVHSGCYNRIPQTGWLKQKIFISHTSGGWKVQEQGAGRSSVLWRPTSWFSSHCVLTWLRFIFSLSLSPIFL